MRSLLSMFRKPKAEAAPRLQATLQASSPAEAEPSCGLLTVHMTLGASEPSAATLRVRVDGAEGPEFETPVELSAQPRDLWVAVHSQLLPNGPARTHVSLVDSDGGLLAETSVTLQVANAGETARQVGESLRARGTPLVVSVCDSTLYDYADPKLTAWFDRSPDEVEAHLAGLAERGEATPEEIAALRHFVAEGYLVLPERIPPEQVARINAAIDDAVARKVEGYEWGASQRIHNLHHDYPAIRELWLHPKVMRMLELIFGEPARPCQSLTYVFGSEQQYHQDTIHLTPFPQGRMCGVWTALEDVQPDSGELVVFPKSHRLARVYMASAGAQKVKDDWTEFGDTVVPLWTEMIEKHRLAREVYRPKAGEVLIWHENLLHAGQPRRDRSISRRSIVGHYFARGSVAYYDSSGLPASLHQGA